MAEASRLLTPARAGLAHMSDMPFRGMVSRITSGGSAIDK